MQPGRAPGSGATLAIAIALAALALTVCDVATRYVPETWIQRDGRFYVNVNTTLVERLSVDQGEFAASWYEGNLGWNRSLDAAWSNVALGRNGEHLPKHPILLPLLSTPLFWAFGLLGALIFNVLLYGAIAAAAYSLARRFASVPAAAFAALALPLATGIRDHAYDYHVDVLMLALFTSAMALLYARRGAWAGLLLGAAVVLRPTALLWLPSLALLVIARKDWRTLKRALIAGTIPLVLFAISNVWLFGRPWWSGYNRVLVVVNGEPQIADVGDAFGVPFREGLRNLWSGPYGARHRLTLLFVAIPGLLLLLRRRPLYVLAALAGVAGSVVLFAKYRWYGDRFLWPSCALLVPALAVAVDAISRSARKRPWWRPALVASLGAMAIVGASATIGPSLEDALRSEILEELALRIALFGALAFGLTRAAERAGAGPFAIVAPLALVLLPGVRERVLAGGPDLYFASALVLAIGARHWLPSLIMAALTAWIGAATLGERDPSLLFTHLADPTSRAIVVLLVLTAISLPMLGRASLLLLPIAALAVPRIASLGGASWPLFALALLCLPLPTLTLRSADVLARLYRESTPRGRMLAFGTVLAALLVTGVAKRAIPDPFRIASYHGVRTAEVHLGDIPCDFLAWEHLNWECSTFDHGVHGETGLATSEPLHVAGREAPLFLITTQGSRNRSVRWHDLTAERAMAVRWAVPDELRGGGTLMVRMNDRDLAEIVLSREPDHEIHEARIDTSAYAGRKVTLELDLRGPGSAVLVDGELVR